MKLFLKVTDMLLQQEVYGPLLCFKPYKGQTFFYSQIRSRRRESGMAHIADNFSSHFLVLVSKKSFTHAYILREVLEGGTSRRKANKK